VRSSRYSKNLANGKFLKETESLMDQGKGSAHLRQHYDETLTTPSNIQQGMTEAQIETAERKMLAKRANSGNYLCHNYEI